VLQSKGISICNWKYRASRKVATLLEVVFLFFCYVLIKIFIFTFKVLKLNKSSL